MTTKVLIVDDHNIVRSGLEAFLSLDKEIEIVGMAENGREAVQKSQELNPDVVLMDLLMPEMDGFEATARLKHVLPRAKVLILTSLLEKASVSKGIRAGANGYLLKTMDSKDLRQAIKASNNEALVFDREALNQFMDGPADYAANSSLTEREKQVLIMVAKGQANKEIAYQLKLSEGTIKTHVSVILAKLGLQSRTQAALYVSNAGFLPEL